MPSTDLMCCMNLFFIIYLIFLCSAYEVREHCCNSLYTDEEREKSCDTASKWWRQDSRAGSKAPGSVLLNSRPSSNIQNVCF